MQIRRLIAVAGVLAAPVAAVTVSTEARAQAQAVAFLRVHAAPQQDELAELRAVNPNAYAIVKALLTKRSLGLLDPKHPSASFASHAAPIDDATPSGPEAFKAIAQESGEKSAVAVPYEAAPVASEHHDWLNWKPQQSAVDDEAMVNSVLGAVAQIKGGQNLRGAAVNSDSEAATEESAESTPPPPPPSTTPEAHDAPKPAGENSYLKGLDLMVDDSEAKTPGQETITPEATTPATEKEAPANPPMKDNAQGDALAIQLRRRSEGRSEAGASGDRGSRRHAQGQEHALRLVGRQAWQDRVGPEASGAEVRCGRAQLHGLFEVSALGRRPEPVDRRHFEVSRT